MGRYVYAAFWAAATILIAIALIAVAQIAPKMLIILVPMALGLIGSAIATFLAW